MKIAEYIHEKVLSPRLKQHGCLVVYDPEHRYRELCQRLETDRIKMVDATESSIESREAAVNWLRELGREQSSIDGLVVYVPAPKPLTEEHKQIDPFALYTVCGAVFPMDDDSDDYRNLCLKARKGFEAEIRRVFAENPSPGFAVIDAIGGGIHWPQLRALLGVESSRDILKVLLTPDEKQVTALAATDTWIQEAREFARTTLGLEIKTRAKRWEPITEELWRFLLFSEFVFDLPETLPESLASVPHAPSVVRPLVDEMCDLLRSDIRTKSRYLERAEAIEQELNLPNACLTIEDLGIRDTFPFEERTFLRQAIDGLVKNDLSRTERVISQHGNSIWVGKGENQEPWALLQTALNLVKACGDFEGRLTDHTRTLENLIDFYTGHLCGIDRLQREFEQAVGDILNQYRLMDPVIQQARSAYRRLVEKVQTHFVRNLEASGWPPTGRLSNTDVFDRFVGKHLKERGYKVAYVMVDALRYELGVVLEKQLVDDGPVELHAALAQLPTITPVGMASLLPGARAELTLGCESDKLVPKLAGVPVTNVTQRMEVLSKRYGDRFAEMPLSDFVRSKKKLASTVDLLVLRSTEIDSYLETNPETALEQVLKTLKLIRTAIHRLRELNFQEVVIVTDHGFFLNAHAEAGDVCTKPNGKWLVAHDRMLLGDGVVDDAHNFVISAEKLGVRGGVARVAGPRSMAPYSRGHLYFHGGLSLAEAVVPVLVIPLARSTEGGQFKFKVELAYKNGAKRITTRLPVIQVSLFATDLLSLDVEVEILLEAHDPAGNVVGEPRLSSDVNPATRTITLSSGGAKQIVVRMDSQYEGKFTLKALDPTTMTTLSHLSLETDYTV